MNTLKAGMILSSTAAPNNWLRVEAVEPDGGILFSFPGEPEKGTARIEAADWAAFSAELTIIPAPLSQPVP